MTRSSAEQDREPSREGEPLVGRTSALRLGLATALYLRCDIELVALRVGHERPGVAVLLVIGHASGAETDEPGDLGLDVFRDDVQVQAVLAGLRLRHLGEYPGRLVCGLDLGPPLDVAAGGEAHARETTVCPLVEGTADRGRPEPSDGQRVGAIERHARDSDGHDDSSWHGGGPTAHRCTEFAPSTISVRALSAKGTLNGTLDGAQATRARIVNGAGGGVSSRRGFGSCARSR